MSKYSIQNDTEIQQSIERNTRENLIKSRSIEFAVFLSNHNEFENFCFMNKELQEQIYLNFINNKHE